MKYGQKNCYSYRPNSEVTLYYSYDTLIAVGIKNHCLCYTTRKYSVTTSKHLNMFKREWIDLILPYQFIPLDPDTLLDLESHANDLNYCIELVSSLMPTNLRA